MLDEVDNYILIENAPLGVKDLFYKKYINKTNNLLDFEKVIKIREKNNKNFEYDLFKTHGIWGSSLNCETVTGNENYNFTYDEEEKRISMQIRTCYATRIDDDYAYILFPGVPWPVLKKISEDPILKDCQIIDIIYDINKRFVGTIAYYNGNLILNVLKRINPDNEEEISEIYDNGGYEYDLNKAISENKDYEDPNKINIDVILRAELKNKDVNKFLNRYCTDFHNLNKDPLYKILFNSKNIDEVDEDTKISNEKSIKKYIEKYPQNSDPLICFDYNKYNFNDDDDYENLMNKNYIENKDHYVEENGIIDPNDNITPKNNYEIEKTSKLKTALTFKYSIFASIQDLVNLISELSDLYPRDVIYYLNFSAKEQYVSGKIIYYNNEEILLESDNHNYKNKPGEIDFKDINKKIKKLNKE